MRAICILFFLCVSAYSSAQSTEHSTRSFPIVDGIVEDIVAGDHYTVLHGTTLNRIGPYLGTGVVLDATTGARDSGIPLFHKKISAVISDGNGGWFVAGISIDDYHIPGLVHIKADKTMDESWGPTVPSGVNALVLEGNTLYVAGSFSEVINRETGTTVYRYRLAAFNATTGQVLDWSPAVNGEVKALAISNGILYAGGKFTTIDGIARKNIAAIDGVTEALAAWSPSIDGTNSAVHDIVISGNAVYVGGTFTTAAAASRKSVAAIDKTTGTALTWDAVLDATAKVNTLVVSGTTLFIGGSFLTVGGQSRKHLAAVQTDNGTLVNWNPAIDNPEVLDLALSGTILYVAGTFTSINSAEKKGLAAINTATGAIINWATPDISTLCLAVAGNNIFVGSDKSFRMGWMPCNQFAVVNNATGAITLADLDLDGGDITEMAMVYDVLYLSGTFTKIKGTSREHLAALNLNTGDVLPWEPVTDGNVYAFSRAGGRLFFGGDFTNVNGTARSGLAAVGLTTGDLSPWTCNLEDGEVHALDVRENTLYVGGTFSSIKSTAKHRMAAVDIATGNVLTWNAENFDLEDVHRIEATEDVIIVNDLTLSVTGFDAVTSEIMFNIPADIHGFVPVGNSLIVGGPFDFIDPFTFNGLAQISLTTALPTEWFPDVLTDTGFDPAVFAVARNAEYVFIGGGFRGLGFENRTGFGAYAFELPECETFGEITFDEETLTAPAGGDSYHWLLNDSIMEDATLQTFDPTLTESGSYAIVIEQEGCPATWRYFEYEYEEPEEPITGTEHQLRSAVKIYPNPARDLIQLDIPETENVHAVTLHNSVGQLVRIKTQSDQPVMLTGLPPGSYVVTVRTNAGSRSFKIIKIP